MQTYVGRGVIATIIMFLFFVKLLFLGAKFLLKLFKKLFL